MEWHHILTHTKKGIAKLTPQNCRRSLRDPVSFDHTIALWKGLNLSNTHDAAIWAVMCTAWCGITRSVDCSDYIHTFLNA
jgi:hypothetical protein